MQNLGLYGDFPAPRVALEDVRDQHAVLRAVFPLYLELDDAQQGRVRLLPSALALTQAIEENLLAPRVQASMFRRLIAWVFPMPAQDDGLEPRLFALHQACLQDPEIYATWRNNSEKRQQQIAEMIEQSLQGHRDEERLDDLGIRHEAQIQLHQQLFDVLHEESTVSLPHHVDWDEFNLQVSRQMTDSLMARWSDPQWCLDAPLNQYKTALKAQLWQQLAGPNPGVVDITQQALSALFDLSVVKNQQEKMTIFLDSFANAYAFIQATGFSTQNEASYLGLFDLYNSGRVRVVIAEAQGFIASMLEPFLPLVQEYCQIARHEKNIFLKIWRTLMPMLVIASVIIAICAGLAFASLPEIAFMIVLIPGLYVALTCASLYVATKDRFYHSLRMAWYQDPYAIPEFQVNQRLLDAFGETQAPIVRDYYVEALKQCTEKERTLSALGSSRTQDQITERAANQTRQQSLLMEWYDLMENEKLGIDQLPQVFAKRFSVDEPDLARAIDVNVDCMTRRIHARLSEDPVFVDHPMTFFTCASIGRRPQELVNDEDPNHLFDLLGEIGY